MSKRKEKNNNTWLWILLALLFLGTGIGRFFLGAAAVLAIAIAVYIITKAFKKDRPETEKTGRAEEDKPIENVKRGAPVKETVAREEELPGMDPADVPIFREARKHQRNIRFTARRIRLQEVQTAAEEYCKVIDRILRALKTQPDEVRTVQLFLQYNLPAAYEMLNKYGQMEDSGAADADVSYKVLSYLREASAEGEKQLQAIFADDVAGIDAELELLRQTREGGI